MLHESVSRSLLLSTRPTGTATRAPRTSGPATSGGPPITAWYTEGWLDLPRDAPILDIGCGSGQFLYFLRGRGFTDAVGIDLDVRQVEIGQALGLDCRVERAMEFLRREPARSYGLVAMLDIIEHFTREELAHAADRPWWSGWRRAASCWSACRTPRARPAWPCYFADITHEMAFSTTLARRTALLPRASKVVSWRRPVAGADQPRPEGLPGDQQRREEAGGRRGSASSAWSRPRLWSPVMWALAEKVEPRAVERLALTRSVASLRHPRDPRE